ncbi:MAG: outer membrane beta-barrel protein, partial [Verrucomicrobia bacterium]|nr:outer membrane beta-barrel protein [Verrucomicrobiota bacterium]
YNYDDSGPGSNSALLDRMENAVHLDSRWTLQPQTIGIVGYMFTQVGYTGDEVIGFAPGPIMSDSRNSRGNTVYVGVEHSFTPDLSGSLKGGVQVYDFYNDPNAETKTTPYVQGSLKYMYRPTSSVQAGVSLMQTPTDAFNAQGNSYVLNAESVVVYGSWVHEILPKLYSNVNGSFQQSKYNGGSVDGENSMYYRVGLSLSYEFTKLMSASVGYNWDQSDTPDALAYQSYNRNRVYIGLTAAY